MKSLAAFLSAMVYFLFRRVTECILMNSTTRNSNVRLRERRHWDTVKRAFALGVCCLTSFSRVVMRQSFIETSQPTWMRLRRRLVFELLRLTHTSTNHHNGDQAAPRQHLFCWSCGRRFGDSDKDVAYDCSCHNSRANQCRHIPSFCLYLQPFGWILMGEFLNLP